MSLKEKIYDFIKQNQYFGKNYDFVIKNFMQKNNMPKSQKEKVISACQELMKSSKITLSRENTIQNASASQTHKESLTGHVVRKGNHVKIETKIGEEYLTFPVSKQLAKTLPNKAVVAFTTKKVGKDILAIVTDVLKIENSVVTGTVSYQNQKLVLIPDDTRFEQNLSLDINANDVDIQDIIGKKVKVVLNKQDYISANPSAVAVITSSQQIIGDAKTPWAHFESAIIANGIEVDFSDEVVSEAEKISDEITEEEIKNRVDYRDKIFITIDPETTKDMDDAVCVEPVYDEKGFVKYYDIYIAIADVSHYIKPGTAMDKDCFKRGNSYYPGDHCIPMAHPHLSNHVCSLNPNVDRLAVVTKVRLSPNGEVMSYQFDRGIIKSRHKFSYQEVSDLHSGKPEAVEKFEQYKQMIDTLYQVDKKLAKVAHRNGKISFKGFEPSIKLNQDKSKVLDIVNENFLDSHRVIENLMVLNNMVVAEFLNNLNVTHLLRVHGFPTSAVFQNFKAQLRDLHIEITGSQVNQTFQNLIKDIDGSVFEKLITVLAVRSMQKAEYDIDPEIGHYALGAKAYAHFTSPIRRYPDLLEHRILFKVLEIFNQVIKENNIDTSNMMTSELVSKVLNVKKANFSNLTNPEAILKAANHLNKTEKMSIALEKFAFNACLALYMEERIGQKFKGYVSLVTEEGAIVTLKDPNDLKHSDIIEVFIPRHEIEKAKETSPKVKLGEHFEVLITSVDLVNKTVYATHNLKKEFNKTNQTETKKQRDYTK